MTFFWAPKKRLVFTLGEVIVHSPSLWRMWYVLLSKCLKRRTHDGTAFLPLQGATFKNTFNAFFSFFFFWMKPEGNMKGSCRWRRRRGRRMRRRRWRRMGVELSLVLLVAHLSYLRPPVFRLPWGRLFKLPQNCSWLAPFPPFICRETRHTCYL